MLLAISPLYAKEIDVHEMRAGDSFGNTPEGNTDLLQSAFNMAASEGIKVVYLPADTYTISDTLVVPSGLRIRGDVARLGTKITLKQNKPILVNSAWANNSHASGTTVIHDIWLEGSKTAGTNNHCLILTDYSSEVYNMYFSQCGGYGAWFSSTTENGNIYQGSTLVNNKFHDNTMFNVNMGFRNGILSDTHTPRLTDGQFYNNIIDLGGSSNRPVELYEAAGWRVFNIHTYAHLMPWRIDRASNLQLAMIYVENVNQEAICITKATSTINVTNVAAKPRLTGSSSVFSVSTYHWNPDVYYNFLNVSSGSGLELEPAQRACLK